MARKAVLALDEGTTNCKAVLVSEAGEIIARGASPVPVEHPAPGWAQQDAEEIWIAARKAISACLEAAPDAEPVALGISNQRESILIWDRDSGKPLGPVASWQCRRASEACQALKEAGREPEIIARTGLPLDPLFPAAKAAWLVENHGRAGGGGGIRIGTVDSWLIWKFSAGKVHASDRSNAARTQLFDIAEGRWDETLCELFGIDSAMLPEVHDSSHDFGKASGIEGLPDGIPIASAIGDSHAALFGHGAFGRGDGKITFGTGSSVMATIPGFVAPPDGIATTIAWSLNGASTYAFEGNILASASILPWTAELLGLDGVEALLELASGVETANGVSLVPAHAGLGAPHWEPNARGVICGLSFASRPAHVARAAAESMALQAQEVFSIMDGAANGIGRLFVDGGPSRNRFLMQLVADCLGRPVTPCGNPEASAVGAAYLAGLSVGFWPGLDAVAGLVEHGAEILPGEGGENRELRLSVWRKAVARAVLGA